MTNAICCDCGGFDIEWMYRCDKHKTWRCRGCECQDCAEEAMLDDDYPLDLEDQLEDALNAAFPRAKP